MIWLGLRQLVATVLLSIAGLQPVGAVAADAPRYEIELRFRVDSRNQSLSAETLRLIEMRAHASAWMGSRGLNIVMFHDSEDTSSQKMVVRGTTVPRLLERLLTVRTIDGWGRDAMTDAGKSRPRRTKYDEAGPLQMPRWGASDGAQVYLEIDSDERAVQAVDIGREASEDVLMVTLEEPGPDHRMLIAGGMAVSLDETAGRPLAALALPQAAEEEAAILGLMRMAPQALPQSVVVLESQIRNVSSEGMPATVTQRVEAAKSGTPAQLDEAMRDFSPLVRRRAVLTAAERGAKARKVLDRALSDADPMVVAPALQALIASGQRVPEGLLTRMADSRALDLARVAVEALMRGGTSGQASALRMLRDDRLLAASLGAIRAARFTRAAPLVEALSARTRVSQAVRAEASETLAALAKK